MLLGANRGLRRGDPPVSSNTTKGPWNGGSSGRGWGARGGSWGRNWSKLSTTSPDDAPLGDLVAEISLEDVKNFRIPTTAKAKISNVNYVASYSLVDSDIPKILVPGQPATWNRPDLPAQLSRDEGQFLRDQNGARFPDHPLLPSVQAIFAMNRTFDSANVDFLCCASSLGNILRFVQQVETTFRFDVEMVGNTLFFIQNAKKETIPDVKGYGHEFLKTFTSYTEEVSETKSHQRLVSYDFGNLKCLVRFECDGYDSAAPKSDNADTFESGTGNFRKPNLEQSLHVDIIGRPIPQESIIEIKTRSLARGSLELSENLPRLWIRQIPTLVAGYHRAGRFEDVQKTNMTEKILEWEENSEQQLLDFSSVLHRLMMEIKRASHLRLEVYRSDTGPLQIREQVGEPRKALPDIWLKKWAGQPTLDLDKSSLEDLSDDEDEDDDDENPRRVYWSDSDDYENYADYDDYEGDAAVVDYTACDRDCGYCGRCVY